MVATRRGRVREIEGTNAEEVLRVHREVERLARERMSGPWRSGMFYLLAAITVVGVVTIATWVVSPWLLPLVMVGCLLVISVVGVLQLRQDDRLSERGFVELMRMALSNLPAVLRRDKAAVARASGDRGSDVS